MVRLDSESDSQKIEMVHGAPVYRLRDKLLPIIYLSEILETGSLSKENEPEGPINIVVLQAGVKQFGLIVNEVSDTQEIVVKALGKKLKGIKNVENSSYYF